VSGLLVLCHRCGKEVSSSEVRVGLCLECRISDSLRDLRAEHARLWRKRERYSSQGANAGSIGRQIARVEDRMAERIVELVPDTERAAALLEKELEQARQQRYEIRRA
jgi:hypothetical protein